MKKLKLTEQRTQYAKQYVDETVAYSLDMSVIAGREGISVSSAVVTSEHGFSVLSNQALASNVVTIDVEAVSGGCELLKGVFMMSDGQSLVRYIEIDIKGASC